MTNAKEMINQFDLNLLVPYMNRLSEVFSGNVSRKNYK